MVGTSCHPRAASRENLLSSVSPAQPPCGSWGHCPGARLPRARAAPSAARTLLAGAGALQVRRSHAGPAGLVRGRPLPVTERRGSSTRVRCGRGRPPACALTRLLLGLVVKPPHCTAVRLCIWAGPRGQVDANGNTGKPSRRRRDRSRRAHARRALRRRFVLNAAILVPGTYTGPPGSSRAWRDTLLTRQQSDN